MHRVHEFRGLLYTAKKIYELELYLGHSNLIYCFTSRIARKSESVGRNKFVNVMYEYHYKVMNIIGASRSEPHTTEFYAFSLHDNPHKPRHRPPTQSEINVTL